MRLFQVRDKYDGEVGIFATERTDDNIVSDIENAFTKAVEMEYLDPSIDMYEAAETYLDEKGIWREFVEDVIVDTE